MGNNRVRVYFQGLNGLRFFAALAVIVSHLEMTLKYKGYYAYWHWIDPRMKFNGLTTILHDNTSYLSYFISLAGYCGVNFFFVLSGFLISYLLIVEKEQEGFFSIKSFYIRRLLRIWPLYYLLVIVGFFVIPNIDWFYVKGQTENFSKNFTFNFLSYIFMLPNLAASYKLFHVPNIGHLWSIGVEEQFYLTWPFLMRWLVKSKKMIFGLIIFLICVKIFVILSPVSEGITRFVGTLKFEAMAVGALGAFWLYYNKPFIERMFFSIPVQILSVLSIPMVLLFVPYRIFDTLYLFLSFPFLILILNVSCNPSSLIKLENRVLNYLGKISYGIYMYHLLVVTFVVNFATEIFNLPSLLTQSQRLLFYISSISITILISALSYRFFEHPFIKLKSKFSKVLSGEQVKKWDV